MTPDIQPLIEYIKSHRAHNTHDNKIWTDLLNANWTYEHIQQAFDAIDGEPATPDPPYQPAAMTEIIANKPGAKPPKYTIRAALADVISAVKINWQTTLIGLIAVVIIGVAALVLTGLAWGLVSNSLSAASVFVFIVGYFFTLLLTSTVNGLIVSVIALSVKDGLNGSRGTIGATLKRAFQTIVRVILTSALTSIVIGGPLVIGAIIMLFTTFSMLFTGGSSGAGGNIAILLIGLIAMVGGFAWAIIAMLRYALTPYVALFEQDVPIAKTLGRSKHLLTGGGQWFLCKGFLVILVIAVILAIVSGQSVEKLANSSNVAVALIDVVLTFVCYGVLYALYRNRASLKG